MTTIMSTSPSLATLAGLHVLLVDDDAFIHEMLGAMLRKLGASRISIASDGTEGIAALNGKAGVPDIVICDLHMPGVDGFQVMEAMAAANFNGAVMLLSGMEQRVLNSASLMGRFHQLNLLGVVQKPVSQRALSELMAKARGKTVCA